MWRANVRAHTSPEKGNQLELTTYSSTGTGRMRRREQLYVCNKI